MDVFAVARRVSFFDGESNRAYTCLACKASFDIQYHACPACGAYDIRRTEWIE